MQREKCERSRWGIVRSCENGRMQYFRPSLSYHLSLKYLFYLFLHQNPEEILHNAASYQGLHKVIFSNQIIWNVQSASPYDEWLTIVIDLINLMRFNRWQLYISSKFNVSQCGWSLTNHWPQASFPIIHGSRGLHNHLSPVCRKGR